MATINPYLNFNGQAEEAFNFYRSVFGGEFIFLQRMKEIPGGNKLPESEKELILHIALPVGKGNILMGSDTLESQGNTVTVGNNFHIALSTDSEEETDKLFAALSDGGKITMPVAKMFWGDYFGMCTDRFGIQWMVSYEYNRQY